MTTCAEKRTAEKKCSGRVGLERRKKGIGPASRQSNAERAEARWVFGWERSVSCRRAGLRWRAKLDFGGGEPLDDPHRSTTFRAGVQVAGVFGGGSVFFVRRLLCRTQQLKTKREELGASSAGQKAPCSS